MAAPQKTVKLNNGLEMPVVGLGTWKSEPGEVSKAVEYALKDAGYRHIDCAFGYGNEKEVGEGIKASGVPREQIWITSKLWSTYHQKVEEALDITLKNLDVEYLDLFLMHWPVPLRPNEKGDMIPLRPDGSRDVDEEWKISDTWKQFEDLQKKGKVRSIGVSNMSQKTLEQFLPKVSIKPVVDQLEIHVYNPQHELLSYLRQEGIVAQAYSPLGSTGSPLMTDEAVVQAAKAHGLQPVDVLLGYLVAKDIVCLPKSVTPKRIESNYTGAISAASKLTPEDIAKLDGLAAAGKQKRFVTPPWPVDLSFADWPTPPTVYSVSI
ncbi:NADP-dependent oxidoreductase domain-containing protein [Schizophyllum amplum]|uniref:NADP-dependent oxidoreductase domain-containing protein n=1 Tax=Schizophyllum amplum TaxID=97359 RepID=A0A550D0C0_9AGAR|nr:NADP-dependent oxidoreductase domain-containing protein [Auriculariopsis ampla]